jgi:hypothetical protein
MAMARRSAWSTASIIAEHPVKWDEVNRCAASPTGSPMRKTLRAFSTEARISKLAFAASTLNRYRRARSSTAFAPTSPRL